MNVEAALLAMGYKIGKKVGNKIYVASITHDRAAEIKNLAKALGGVMGAAKSSVGRIVLPGKFIYMTPDSKKGTETLGIQATTLIRGGKNEHYPWADDTIRSMTFTNTRQLADSIISGLKGNNKVPEYITKFMKDLLHSKNFHKFDWSEDIQDNEKNQLGKYMGEMLLGFLALDDDKDLIKPAGVFGRENITKFIVPDDPSFAGIDSLLETASGMTIPVSSKFGTGAKASFFANLAPKGLQYESKLGPSVFKDLMKTTKSMNITQPEKFAMQILFEHGIRSVLKIDRTKVPDTFAVYNAIKDGKAMEAGAAQVIAAVREMTDNQRIKDTLPLSVGGFLSRQIAKQLNEDNASMDQMKGILAGKDFYQANLNIPAWLDGRIEYKMLRTTGVTLKIIGDKSALGDVKMNHGKLNYELRVG